MTEIQLAVCQLIGKALFNSDIPVSGKIDWNEVYYEMSQQTVQGLVINNLKSIPLPSIVEKKWKKDAIDIMVSVTAVGYAQMQLDELFEREGISYLIIKGTSAAINYPNPLLRTVGDVDLYVPTNQLHIAAELMRKSGYIENKHDEYNKRHLSFVRDNVYYELHKTYATVNGRRSKEYVDGLLDQCCVQESKKNEIGWVRYTDDYMNFKMPSVSVNGIVLLEHIAHHLMGGLGMKQVLDWLVYVNRELDDERWNAFQVMAKKAGLEKLAKVVTRVGQLYFGLSTEIKWCNKVDSQICQEFLEYVFANGNAGKKRQEIGKIARVSNKLSGMSNFFINIQRAGEYNWEAYRGHRWLKPFAGVYQIFRYFRQVISTPNVLKNFIKGLSEAKKRKKMMEKMGVYIDK